MADENNLLQLTADIVAAHVANNSVAIGDVSNLVQRVHEALAGLGGPAADAAPARPEPRVSIRASVKPDAIICLLDGSKHKMLRRHLMTAHQMTPREYRALFELRDDYPMVAPNYSDTRRQLAVNSGLGRKRGDSPAQAQSGKAPGAKGRRPGGAKSGGPGQSSGSDAPQSEKSGG